MPYSKHMLATLTGLTLALTACSSEQGEQIQELPRPDFIEAGQNFTGAPHFKYTLGPGEDADCEGKCESIMDSCALSGIAHTVALVRPGVVERIGYEDGCTFGNAFYNTYNFDGEVLAVAGGQKLPKTVPFVAPLGSDRLSYCAQHSESFLASVRIVGGKHWIINCLPIDERSLEPFAVNDRIIVQLPSSFEELSQEVQAALRDYDEFCQREVDREMLELLDTEFARHEECPLRESRPSPEPEDEPGGDEFEN